MTDFERKQCKAFELLVREHASMLTAYLRAVVRDETAVDDLFQETMLVAWRKLDDCDLSQPFGPWLRAIAARLVMAYFRQRQRAMLVCNETVLDYLHRQLQSIHERTGDTWDEKLSVLRDCIAGLPEHYRSAVRRRYLDGETARELADDAELSIEALKKRLQRARMMLLECLRQHEVLLGPTS